MSLFAIAASITLALVAAHLINEAVENFVERWHAFA